MKAGNLMALPVVSYENGFWRLSYCGNFRWGFGCYGLLLLLDQAVN